MLLQFLLWLASAFGENVIGVAAGRVATRILGRPLGECEQAAESAIESARSVFHAHYGDTYGPLGSTFIDRDDNRARLLRSTFPRESRLNASDLDPRGFDGAQEAPEEARTVFLNAFENALDQTESRVLDRDQALQVVGSRVEGFDRRLNDLLQEKVFPDPIRAALAQPHLDELSDLMREGRAHEALAYAVRSTETIDTALEAAADQSGHYAEALRTHRQRLLFAAASAASWQGDQEAGRSWWHRARDLGPVDPEWHEQAVAALFNVGLADDLRHLMTQMNPASDLYRRTVPLLAFLDKDWRTVDEQLADAQSPDLLLTRVHARLQTLDPLDVEAVQTTAELLERVEGEHNLAKISLAHAQSTFDLLTQVVEGYTPLEYDRRPLIDSVVRRTLAAVEGTAPDTLLRAQALGLLASAAELLRDATLAETFEVGVEALDEAVRSTIFFRFNPAPAPEEVDGMLAAGQLIPEQAVVLHVAHFRAAGRPEEVERVLRRALFATPDERQRAQVLRMLTRHLRQANRAAEAQGLVENTPLRPADRWLLRTENPTAGETPIDLAGEIGAFPLDVDVIEQLAQSGLAAVESAPLGKGAPDEAIPDHAERAVHWVSVLVQVLPSRSSRLLHAEALLAARHYDALLAASRDLDPVYAERAAELEAWALDGLGRRSEAADLLASAAAVYPHAERLAVNAAALLLADDRPAEAANILEPRVTAGAVEPGILVNYARSLLVQAPNSREQASYAFDLLARAYDRKPDPGIAGEAWKAARGARREREAGRFFAAMVEGAPRATVETAAELDEVMGSAGHRFVQFDGGMEALAERIRRDQERTDALNMFSSAHALAYTDLFQLASRPWEHWSRWTQRFERRRAEGVVPHGGYSVLADWPSAQLEYARQHTQAELSLFADPTAILTLGVLGPDMAQELVEALGTLYVQWGTLNGLREEMGRIEADLLISAAQPYAETAILLRQAADAIIPYTEELEAVAPDNEALGATRVDLGAAVLHEALYVTDVERADERPGEAHHYEVSSAVLLASLNATGAVTADEARSAADKHPDAFRGWETAAPVPIPDAIVFSEFALLSWVDVGLDHALGHRIRVGPWAWTQIADAAERQEALALAYERVQGVLAVLRPAVDAGTVVEIEAVADVLVGDEAVTEDGGPAIERLWERALQSLRTAQHRGLQLWADDRFYSLLLWAGGPTVNSPEIEAVRAPLIAWADSVPPLPTMGVLDRLARSGGLDASVAQDAAAQLFDKGYRPAHPLLLDRALRQYPAPTGGALPPPFQFLVNSIAELPHYLPESIDAFRRGRFIRAASMNVAKRFVIGVWEAEGLDDAQRRILADAFLDAIERVFDEASREPTAPRSDRTPLFFWRAVSSALQLLPVYDRDSFRRRDEALRWLGDAAYRRVERRQDIVRLLEDNVLAAVEYTQEALNGVEQGQDDPTPRLVGTFAAPALIPLIGSDLILTLDSLLRRTMGTLVGLDRDGRLDTHYSVNIGGEDISIAASEEDDEAAAVDVIGRAVAGDQNCARLIHATDIVFSYSRPAPTEWVDAGFPPDGRVPINVRCSLFTLLWADPPGLRELIVRLLVFHLAALDPDLAYRVLTAEEDLLSDDPERSREARDELAVEVLRSGYFDLQRDLAHAVWRFRQYEQDVLSRFLGWIGEDAARALAEHPATVPVQQVGAVIVPQAHYIGRSLLTDRFDDSALVLEAAKEMVDRADGPDGEQDPWPTLTEWLANRASVAESADDPFTAAWALRQVLLVPPALDQNPELEINGQTVRASDWVAGYLATAFTVGTGAPSVLEQRMVARRRLASAALQLAAFACSGDEHFAAYAEEEDPLAEWLDRVWLMTSKLQGALVGLEGGLPEAAAAATSAVQDLGLATPDARVLDAFDPFAFGFEGDDIGVALTLTAMLKALRHMPADRQPPFWWNDEVRVFVEELADPATHEADPINEEMGNRFELVAPLRVRTLASEIVQIVDTD